MALPLWIDNLIAYSLQMAILAAAGTLLAYLFRLRIPRVSLLYWQVLLLACLFLPVLQKWERPVVVQTSAVMETTEILIPGTGIVLDPEPAKISATGIILIILAAGALLRLIWLGLGFLRLRLYLRKSKQITNALPDTGRISSLIGVQARFFISNEIDSPATFGIFRPIVLLPRSYPEMSETCREAVVYHELLHVRRRDWALVLLEEMVRTIIWFHPAVWWLLSRIHLTREQSVDLEVVKLIGSQKPYLDSLLEIARMHGHPKAFPAPLFLRERHLVQRVALLLKEVSMNRSRLTISLAAIAVLLTGTVLMASGWFPLTGPALIVQKEISAEVTEAPLFNTPEDPVPTQTEQTPAESQEIRLVKSDNKKLDDNLLLNIKDMDLGAFIQQISEILNLSPLIIDPEVQGSATVHSAEPMPKDKVLAIFHQVLRTNNASLIEEDGVYRIIPISSALKTGVNPILHITPEDERVPGKVVGSGSGRGSSVSGSFSGSGSGSADTVTVTTSAPPKSSAASEPSPKQIGGNVLRSKLIYRVDPEYPELAQRARVQDVVILVVTVDEKGNVVKAEPVRGHPLLKDAAVDAVKQWKYEPTLMNGTPIPVTATVTVNFILEDDSPPPANEESGSPDTSQPSSLQIGGNVLRSKLVHRVDPEFPELARRARVQDIVILRVTVDEKGNVVEAEPVRGHQLLKDAAVDAVKQWKYEPTLMNGTPIPVTATVTVNFILDGDKPSPTYGESSPPGMSSDSRTELVNPDNNLSDYVIVKFDNEGKIYINDIKTAPDDFESILREKMGVKNTVFIQANPDIPWSMITDLVDRIRAAGVKKVNLLTKGNPE